MGDDRRGATTERLRDAAYEELLAVGEASWSMDGIARRSGLSIGSLYARWGSTAEVLRDLRTSRIDPALAEATTRPRPLPLVQALDNLDARAGRGAVQALADLALSATTDTALMGDAQDSIARLADAFLLPGEPAGPRSGMRWFVMSFTFGLALLRMAGCPVPPLGKSLGAQLMLRCAGAPARAHVEVNLAQLGVPLEPAASVPQFDVTRARLVDAARTIVIERGAQAAAVKDIAATAGVTTGAIYRRFESKADLLAEVMAVQLANHGDEWSVQFVASLLSIDESADHPAELFVRLYENLLSDVPARRLHVAGMVAARLDPQMRSMFVERIMQAVVARTSTFRQLRDLGVLRREVDPELLAWLFQAPTAGARLLAELGFVPDRAAVASAMHALVDASITGEA